VVVRARCVLPRSDDREVDLVVSLFDDATTEVRRHLGLGATDERDLAALQFAGDPIDRCGGRCECIDLRLVLRHPQRTDHVDGAGVLGAGKLRQQFDEEPRPHLIADGDALRARRQPGDDGCRVLRLTPRQQVEGAGHLADPRCLECGDQHRGVAVAGHDQHGEALEGHRRVSGEIRQVVADRQQQGVDVPFRHRGADPSESIEVDGRIDVRRTHRSSLPARCRRRPSGSLLRR
jgi:hypothetical protein